MKIILNLSGTYLTML